LLSFLIGVATIAAAATMIVRKFQPQAVLLAAGLILLTLTVVLFPDHSILYQKAK
jgi:C4-dicarboxylate transporter, DcuC family